MPVQLVDGGGGILTLNVSGLLDEEDLHAAHEQVAACIRQQGKVCILVLAHAFEGWSRGGEWNDFALQTQTDPHVEKMAIVAEQRWEDLALLFVAQGLRPFPVEFFPLSELARAREWLLAG
jgi:hypothetical protein